MFELDFPGISSMVPSFKITRRAQQIYPSQGQIQNKSEGGRCLMRVLINGLILSANGWEGSCPPSPPTKYTNDPSSSPCQHRQASLGLTEMSNQTSGLITEIHERVFKRHKGSSLNIGKPNNTKSVRCLKRRNSSKNKILPVAKMILKNFCTKSKKLDDSCLACFSSPKILLQDGGGA